MSVLNLEEYIKQLEEMVASLSQRVKELDDESDSVSDKWEPELARVTEQAKIKASETEIPDLDLGISESIEFKVDSDILWETLKEIFKLK